MIILRDIELRRGSKLLLADSSLTIQPGQRIALIGANGSGKSSLLALLLGKLTADSGEIEGLDNLRLAHMAQEVEGTDMPAAEYVWRGDHTLAALTDDLTQLESAGDFAGAAAIHTQLEAMGGYDGQRRAEILLDGLGFAAGAGVRAVSDFSGK